MYFDFDLGDMADLVTGRLEMKASSRLSPDSAPYFFSKQN